MEHRSRYTYDTLNRLSTVVDNRLGTTTYAYDSASNVATVTYPNGIQTSFTYDTLNRITGQGSQLGNYTYVLGSTGNRTGASEPSGRSVSWNYDGIYRLTNEAITNAPSGKNGALSYTLDPVGNRTSDTSSVSGLAPVGGSFNSDDELSAETYDQNGNVLTIRRQVVRLRCGESSCLDGRHGFHRLRWRRQSRLEDSERRNDEVSSRRPQSRPGTHRWWTS